MINISNIIKKYSNKVVIDDLSIKIRKGETVVICGPSGSGKSTLLRLIAGIENVSSGEIIVNGNCINTQNKVCHANGQIGMVFQSAQLYSNQNVFNNIALAPIKVNNISKNEAKILVEELLEKVGLLDKINCYPFQLSGGERQRVAISRAMAMKPKLLILDEPTSALDPSQVKEVLKIIFELARQEQTILLVTHETGFARMVADRIVCLDKGKIVEENYPHKIIVEPKSNVAKKLFGDTMHEISAIDRVILSKELTVGCNESQYLFAIKNNALDKLAAKCCCSLEIKKIDDGDPSLLLRMGKLDLYLGSLEDNYDGLVKHNINNENKKYAIFYDNNDTAWRKAIEECVC